MHAETPAQMSAELERQGFAWRILEHGQPKVELHWHVDQVNTDGQVVARAGATLPNMPGHADHVSRYARRGLLPYPPGAHCECRGCRERHPAGGAPASASDGAA